MSGEPIISLRDLHKSYGSGEASTAVLKGVSLEIAEGESVAMVGQSGSGKSTLLNIIGGLDVAESGEVIVFGRDINALPEAELAAMRNRDIGFVFQSFNLLDHVSCLGNVTLPSVFSSETEGIDERGFEVLREVGLEDFAMKRPAELSGGQKQRVAIARALYNRPRLLLCDEPTGNLDSETGREVIEFFQKLNQEQGVTLLIVTHERRVSTVAERVICIEDGLIVRRDGDDAHKSAS